MSIAGLDSAEAQEELPEVSMSGLAEVVYSIVSSSGAGNLPLDKLLEHLQAKGDINCVLDGRSYRVNFDVSSGLPRIKVSLEQGALYWIASLKNLMLEMLYKGKASKITLSAVEDSDTPLIKCNVRDKILRALESTLRHLGLSSEEPMSLAEANAALALRLFHPERSSSVLKFEGPFRMS